MARLVNLNEVTEREPLEIDTVLRAALINLEDFGVKSLSDFYVRVSFQRMYVRFLVRGWISGKVVLLCSRCLSEVEEDISADFSYRIMPLSGISGGRVSPGDMDVVFSDSHFVDLVDIVREQIILSLPVKPLCSESCKLPQETFVGE